MDARDSLLQYWRKSVGIGEWLRPWHEPVESLPESFPVIFLWQGDELELANQEAELLQKVIAALKLTPEQVGLLSATLHSLPLIMPELERSNWVLCFSAELGDFLSMNFPRLRVAVIPTLEKMQMDPAAKKMAWDILKKTVLT